MLRTDVLVIGSSAGGMVVALTGKKMNPEKSFTVITMNEKTLVPCGIPYVFGSVGSTDKNLIPVDVKFKASGIDMIVGEVTEIVKADKYVTMKNGESIGYDKLVLATGSFPYKPKWLKGADFSNVYAVPKNKLYVDQVQEELKETKNIIVIGAGFIGVEMSDELKKAGKNVTLIERLPNILSLAFDADISQRARVLLEGNGVNVLTNTTVKEIVGGEKATGVLFEDGTVLEADAIILSMGYKPNTELAYKAHIPINDAGFIRVDEYLRTFEEDIFAVGDCAEKKHFITRKSAPMMLASIACAEARTVGLNLFGISVIKTFSGTISIFATAINGTGFGVAGITEKEAKENGINYTTGAFEGVDRHPGSLPDTHKQYVKFIVAKDSGVILGGEVVGGLSTGELINTIGIMIQNRMNINSLLTAQIGSHPLLTASPAGFPMIKAAEEAVFNMMKK
ncbi:MAG: pyridine nucleotide-disulfide oxidoreductase [Candidatus Cloacimonetes bacterium 4572_65]|nr:MAG: pyridine nucleotide-disulfide oxidoreductase [Candidatus Cloacimonetes bacterium 4572_65]